MSHDFCVRKSQLCALAVAAVDANVIAMVVAHRNELCVQPPLRHYGLSVDTVSGNLVPRLKVDHEEHIVKLFPEPFLNVSESSVPDGFQELPSFTFLNSSLGGMDFMERDSAGTRVARSPLPNEHSSSHTLDLEPAELVACAFKHNAADEQELSVTYEADFSETTIVNTLEEFSSVFDLETYLKPVKHDTLHFIETEGAPVRSRVRRLSPEIKDNLKKEFDHLLDLDIIEPSNSPFGFAVHLVPKTDGRYRVTGDYRLLNKQTTEDSYPIPFLADFTSSLHGSTVFSNLDLYKFCHQVPVAPKHRHKTALVTPLGSFQFKRMPMGLSNSGKTLLRFMNEIFRDLNFVFVYLDDILIFSRSEQEHLEHLRAVFRRLQDYGLVVNKDECLFRQKQLFWVILSLLMDFVLHQKR